MFWRCTSSAQASLFGPEQTNTIFFLPIGALAETARRSRGLGDKKKLKMVQWSKGMQRNEVSCLGSKQISLTLDTCLQVEFQILCYLYWLPMTMRTCMTMSEVANTCDKLGEAMTDAHPKAPA